MGVGTPFAWYVQRLGSMSAREIVYRFGEQAKRQLLRCRRKGWQPFETAPGSIVVLPALKALMHATWPEELETSLRTATAQIVGGRFSALGRDWPPLSSGLRRDKAWFVDPVTGRSWPGAGTFCFDVGYRNNSELGDVKYVWEANRLQFLHPIAFLAARDGDPKLARYAIETVLSWMEANPPFQGVNWTSGIELALRLVSLAVVVAGAGNALSAEECAKFRQFVAAHAFWLERFPSLYSSANNHRVAEGLGLMIAALLLPDLPASSRYFDKGRAILEAAPRKQFHPDGIGVEQSPTYGAFTLEMLCLGGILLGNTPRAFGPDWLDGLARAASGLQAILDDNGVALSIGDDDEGRVIGTSLIAEPRYAASIVALTGALTSRADLARTSHDAALREPSSGTRTSAASSHAAIDHFASGGYTIVRDTIGDSRMLIVFDHGPLGFGGIAAHGHADALSVWLHVDGMPVIVDSGTFLYHSDRAWRDFFRSTAAHNTLEAAGLSQSVTAGAFNWSHKAQAKCTRLVSSGNWEIEGRHDGYRKRLGLDHIRLLKRTQSGFRIEDRLAGARKPLPVAIRFLVHPDRSVIAKHDHVAIGTADRLLLNLVPSRGMTCRILHGKEEQIGPGWYSPAFGHRVAASCIVIEGSMADADVALSDFLIAR